jgi:hypothetical protein
LPKENENLKQQVKQLGKDLRGTLKVVENCLNHVVSDYSSDDDADEVLNF